jgi:hypothetical protein
MMSEVISNNSTSINNLSCDVIGNYTSDFTLTISGANYSYRVAYTVDNAPSNSNTSVEIRDIININQPLNN